MFRKVSLVLFFAVLASCQLAPTASDTSSINVSKTSQLDANAYRITDVDINNKWNLLGGAAGVLGNPISDTLTTPNGLGLFNRFEKANGHIYRKKTATEAFAVYGLIMGKYGAMSYENGVLGFPVTDELDTYNKTGRYNHFEGGSIHWKKGASAAYETHGSIRSFWSWNGWETGHLGFPTSDETKINKKYVTWVSQFEKGRILANSTEAWPMMSTYSGSAGPGMPSISASFTYYQFVGYYSLKVNGSNFKPGAKVKVYISTHWGAKVFNAIKTVDAAGKFTFNSLDIYSQAESEYITTLNGYATVFARVEGGKEIAIWSGYADRDNSRELVYY